MFALFAHVLFFGYLAGLIGLVTGVVSVMAMILGYTYGVVGLVYLALAIGVIWACRRGEKFIAACCIRQYLRNQSKV